MAFLSSIFSCCEPNRRTIENEAETRRARISSVYKQSSNASLCSVAIEVNTAPPPKYSEIPLNETVIIPADEKNPDAYLNTQIEPIQEEQRSSSPAQSVSDDSSVISIPSTRLSGITSTYTGTSVRARLRRNNGVTDSNRTSWRESIIYTDFGSSPPPSYYAESLAEQDSDRDEPHPVMANGWLDHLMTQAARGGRQDNARD